MSKKPNIIIIGASGHAKVVIDIIERENKYTIIGLIDSFITKDNHVFQYKILGTETDIPKLIDEFKIGAAIIAIGNNLIRKKMYESIKKIIPKLKFINAIHPNAIIGKNVTIERGSVIMPGAIINCDSVIGEFCIINTKASLGHEGQMKEYSSLAPNVTTGGNVKIGKCTAICLGANIKQNINIGEYSIVGAGSLVLQNVDNYKLVYGVPSKTIKTIKL